MRPTPAIRVVVPRRSWRERLRDRADYALGYGVCANCGLSARSMTETWHGVVMSQTSEWYPMCRSCWDANDREARIFIAEQALLLWIPAPSDAERDQHLAVVRNAAATPALSTEETL